MDWYNRLAEYFPARELKNPLQLNHLISTQPDRYQQILTPEILIHFATYAQFVFFDYILVDSACRSRGIGAQYINDFKKLNKWLLLEADPINPLDTYSVRRIAFYERLGFRKATQIMYLRHDHEGEPFPLDIYFWSASHVSQRDIFVAMRTVCEEIHNYESAQYYGRPLVHLPSALQWVPIASC